MKKLEFEINGVKFRIVGTENKDGVYFDTVLNTTNGKRNEIECRELIKRINEN